MTGVGRDIVQSIRALVARPGTTVLAGLALALGIGLTTTMFSIVEGVFLRGLPFDESDRLMYVGRVNAAQPDRPGSAATDDYLEWRRTQKSFEDLGGFTQTSVVVSSGADTDRYRASRLTAGVLPLLHVRPSAGRGFTEQDCAHGAAPVAVIGYRVWTDLFQQSASAVGAVVRVNGIPTVVVGVMADKFGFPQIAEVWLPLEIVPGKKRGDTTVDVIGRLKAGVSVSQARAEMTGVAASLERQFVENKGVRADVMPFMRRFLGTQVFSTLSAMMGAVFGVMLIACGNVATLQLARAADRARDIAVRTALGAGRGRIVRQLLIEGLLLSAIGAIAGLLLGQAGIAVFNRQIVDKTPPFWIDIRIDGTVLAFVTGIAVFAALVSSLLPALRLTRQDVNSVLKDEGRANSGLRLGRVARTLVIGEVLMSCVLLFVSGLMIKGVVQQSSVRYPFPTPSVFSANLAVDDKRYSTDADQAALARRLDERLARVPGVLATTISNGIPTPGGGTPFSIESKSYRADADHPQARLLSGTASYFDVLGVKVLRGRAFAVTDTLDAPRVAIVGEDFAQKYFGGDALGHRIQLGLQTTAPWLTIVGIVPSLAVAPAAGDVTEFVYRPVSQAPRGLSLLVRTGGDPLALTQAIRRAVAEIDPDVAVFNPDSLERSLAQRGWEVRVFGGLFMCFGAGALVMAAAGLYGVMAFSVRTRTQEIGVRMALGAERGRVLRMFVWQGMWRVLAGITLGLAPAWGFGQLMTALLYRVTPYDPLVFGVTVTVLIAAGLAASSVPAFRAASVDPLRALRHG